MSGYPQSGAFLGPLRDAAGQRIEIDDVCAIQFGQDGGPNARAVSSSSPPARTTTATASSA
jgi:hypothetical protein